MSRIFAAPSKQGGVQATGPRVINGPTVVPAPRPTVSELTRGPRLQGRLRIGAPYDRYEREADRVAEQVVNMPVPAMSPTASPRVQRECKECEEERLQRQTLEVEEEVLQRKCAGCEEERLQRQSAGHQGFQPAAGTQLRRPSLVPAVTPGVAPPIVDGVLRSAGRPLDQGTRSFMEQRFGHDFGPVRVHSDGRAAESASSVQAEAYTVGNHVVFGAGRFRPGTAAGKALLAHELTHVLQQRPDERASDLAARPAERGIPVSERAHSLVQRQVNHEGNFPGGGKVETVRRGEFLLWNFDVGADKLKAEHATEIPALAKAINAALAKDSNFEVDIEGQASVTSTDAVNDPLSARRAESVRAALVAAGVDAGRVKVTSVGSRKSLPSQSQGNLARSRGARVILAPKVAAPAPAATPSPTPAPVNPGAGPNVTPGAPTPARTPTSPRTPGPKAAPATPTTKPSKAPCIATPLLMSLTGGTVTIAKNNQVVIQAGDGTAANVGMSFFGAAMISQAGCGELLYVQNVQPFREIVYKDGTRLRQAASSWHLDTSDPYPSWPLPLGKTDLARHTNDSPAQGTGSVGTLAFTEGLINSLEIRDDFRMFLMFKPTTGPRQALMAATWTFIGQALNTTTALPDMTKPGSGGTLQLDSSVSRVIPSSGNGANTSDKPVLSPNVTGLRFSLDRGGLTGNRTFADLFAKILNSKKTGP